MIKIFVGPDANLLKYKIQIAIKPKKIEECTSLFFDDNWEDILDQVNQSGLFDTNTIIIDNCTFLTDKESDNSIDQFPQEKNVFLCLETKNENEIQDKWSKNSEIIHCSVFSKQEKEKVVESILSESNMQFESQTAKINFLLGTYDDPYFVANELKKIIQCCDGNIISNETVNNCMFAYEDENIFKLLNYFLSSKKYECIKLLDDLVNKKYQPVEIVQIMSGQIFNIWLLSQAVAKKMTTSEIEKQLKFSRYQQQMNGKLITNKYDINHLINEMYMLDYNIKHGNVNPYIGLKTFLLK